MFTHKVNHNRTFNLAIAITSYSLGKTHGANRLSCINNDKYLFSSTHSPSLSPPHSIFCPLYFMFHCNKLYMYIHKMTNFLQFKLVIGYFILLSEVITDRPISPSKCRKGYYSFSRGKSRNSKHTQKSGTAGRNLEYINSIENVG